MAQQNGTATQEIMELLMHTGISENLAQCIQMLVNEAMKMEPTSYTHPKMKPRN